MSWFGKLSRTQKLLFGAVICLVGMPVFVILHNVFDMLGGLASDVAILGLVLTALSVGSFFLALFICPAVAGLLFFGALYVYMQQRSSRGGLRLLVIAIAAVAILSILFWFLESLASSHIERDAEAGFNGGFETVRAGDPANRYVYHRSIEDGDMVDVFTRRGRVVCQALFSHQVRVGCIWMPFHFAEARANVLTLPDGDEVTGTAEYKVCAAQVALMGTERKKGRRFPGAHARAIDP